jgi:membrane-bound inhibitor of C-type lysozyme
MRNQLQKQATSPNAKQQYKCDEESFEISQIKAKFDDVHLICKF